MSLSSISHALSVTIVAWNCEHHAWGLKLIQKMLTLSLQYGDIQE